MNTKQRHEEIYAACTKILAKVGGVSLVDSLQQEERIALLRGMANNVAKTTDCHISTAKRNVAKALRRARYDIIKQSWGGHRPGAGRPKKEK